MILKLFMITTLIFLTSIIRERSGRGERGGEGVEGDSSPPAIFGHYPSLSYDNRESKELDFLPLF
jgi:hypothetical protein